MVRFHVNQPDKANLRDLIAATGLVILLKLDSNRWFFSLCDLEIFWWMTLKNNRAPLLYYIEVCVSFQIHRWIQIGVTAQKHSIQVKIGIFLCCATLKFDGWAWKTIGYLSLANIKLCGPFHHHIWIQTGVTVRKQLNWVLTSVNLTFDPWPFAWTSLLSLVITPEHFMMMRWWEHSQKGVTDRQTDGLNYS